VSVSQKPKLTEILADLDLSTRGKFRQKAVLNKVGKYGTFPNTVAFSEFKGNVAYQQQTLDRAPLTNESAWKKKRYEASGHTYISSTGCDVQLYREGVSDWIKLTVETSGTGGGDKGTEFRQLGQISESGKYLFKGYSSGEFDATYGNIEVHCNVLTNSGGYLVGTTNIVYSKIDRPVGVNSKNFYYEATLDLSASKDKYVTLIGRAIALDGGQPGRKFSHEFRDFQLVKI
jgi:hypothetical protein